MPTLTMKPVSCGSDLMRSTLLRPEPAAGALPAGETWQIAYAVTLG